MNTSIVKKEFLNSDEYVGLHLDTKFMYLYLLCCPDKGYLNVFKFNKHFASLCTGISGNSIESGLEQLQKLGYIDVFNGYVGLLKGHTAAVGGQYGAVNVERELSSLPIDVLEHFGLQDGVEIKEPTKRVPKKTGPKPDTIKDIIAKQPEVLREPLADFVADRVERKKAPTTRAVKGWITALEKLYPANPDKQAASVQQSINRGWAGFWEVKDNDRKESLFA